MCRKSLSIEIQAKCKKSAQAESVEKAGERELNRGWGNKSSVLNFKMYPCQS